MEAHPLSALLAPRSVIALVATDPQTHLASERLLSQIKAQRFLGRFQVADVQRNPKRYINVRVF